MDLTRRGLLGRAIAGGGALFAGGLAPRVAFAGPDGEAVFEMRVPAGSAPATRANTADAALAHSAARYWTSEPIGAHRRFELLGIATPPGRDPRAQVRALGEDGRWSDWLDAPLDHGHGPDEPHGEGDRSHRPRAARALSDPVWTGPARVFQLRATRPLTGARLVLVDSGAGAGDDAASAAAFRYVDSGLPAGPGQPPIIARSTWATPACRPGVPYVLGAVELMFVHHTVSSNRYRPGQAAGMIRAICLFHKYGNGWNDIGYNFVVDRFGRIFEARLGGIDEPVVGAQAGGYNVYSSGVALLGTFSAAGPNRRMFDALAHLIAWKLSLHSVALPGDVTVEVTRKGAPYSRYRAGSLVRLNRVAGHRDADATTCPGGGMYRQLPRLRQAVRRLAPAVNELTAQPAPAGPGAAALTGILLEAAAPIAGAVIELQQRTTRGMETVGTATTAADGTWTAAATVGRNASMRAIYRGDATQSAVVSPPVDVTVAPLISLASSAQLTPPGGVIQFTGAITPAKTRLSIVISQQQLDGTFAVVRTIRVAAAADGTFERTIGFPSPGQYQVVAQTAADAANSVGISAPVTITAA